MIRRPPRSTLFPTRRSSDLFVWGRQRLCTMRSIWVRERSNRGRDGKYWWSSQMAGTRSARDRKSTRLNSSHTVISYAVFCLKKKKNDKARAEADENITAAEA